MRRRNLRKRVARKRTRAPKKSTLSTSVKKYVKSAISSEIENKSVQVNQQISFGNYAESPDFNAFPMCPQTGYWTIGQSVQAGSRLGNKIKIKSVYLSYVLRPNEYINPFNLTPTPSLVLMYLGYVKNAPSFVPAAADFLNFFQAGSSVQAPFGTLKDSVAVINKDYWVIKKKWSHKIGFASNDGTGSSATGQYYANNDYKLNAVKRLDITKYCNKTCTFNDGAGGVLNRNLYFMFEAVAANGAATSATTLPVNIDYWIDLTFEDA